MKTKWVGENPVGDCLPLITCHYYVIFTQGMKPEIVFLFIYLFQTLSQQKKQEDEAIHLVERLCDQLHMRSACVKSTQSCSCNNQEKQLVVMVSSPLVSRICSFLKNDSGIQQHEQLIDSYFSLIAVINSFIYVNHCSDGHFTPRSSLQGHFGSATSCCFLSSACSPPRNGPGCDIAESQ